MKNKLRSKIIVSVQIIEEEFEYLMNTLGDMNFFNQYGYKVTLPNHSFF